MAPIVWILFKFWELENEPWHRVNIESPTESKSSVFSSVILLNEIQKI